MFNKILDAVWLTLFAILSCLAALMIVLLFVGRVTVAAASEPTRVAPPCITDTECCDAAEDCLSPGVRARKSDVNNT